MEGWDSIHSKFWENTGHMRAAHEVHVGNFKRWKGKMMGPKKKRIEDKLIRIPL